MARPRKYPDRVATAVRFMPDVHDRLSRAAAERVVPINYLVNLAVQEFLDRLGPAEWTQRPPTGRPVQIKLACSHVWPAATACHAWGAPSSHGCKHDPGHEGSHLCPCGRSDP